MSRNNKKVIFVGGCVRSGTTLLNLILSSTPNAMSLGEVQYIFNPIKEKHYKKLDELKKDSIWSQILKGGEQNLYDNLFKFFPEKELFVDSSKNPFWYEKQRNWNPDLIISQILIYKHPFDLKNSLEKRNRNSWQEIFVNYHSKFFGLLNDFRTVYLDDLISDKKVFARLMNTLDIPYNGEDLTYDITGHPNFFGSDTVKANKINPENLIKRDQFDAQKDALIAASPKADSMLRILDYLQSLDIALDTVPENQSFKYGAGKMLMLKSRDFAHSLYYKIKYARISRTRNG